MVENADRLNRLAGDSLTVFASVSHETTKEGHDRWSVICIDPWFYLYDCVSSSHAFLFDCLKHGA